MIIHLIVELIIKIFYIKMSYFAKPHINKSKIEIELDLSNYGPKKSDLKTQQVLIHYKLLKKMI